jgi:hypothetical protein
MPTFSPEAELDAIAKAAAAMGLAWELGDRQTIARLVDLLKKRPQSPVANAVGEAMEAVLKKHTMIP